MTQKNTGQLSQQDGAAYEVARDVLLQLIGHAASQVAAGAGEWAEKRDRWTSLLNALDPRAPTRSRKSWTVRRRP